MWSRSGQASSTSAAEYGETVVRERMLELAVHCRCFLSLVPIYWVLSVSDLIQIPPSLKIVTFAIVCVSFVILQWHYGHLLFPFSKFASKSHVLSRFLAALKCKM